MTNVIRKKFVRRRKVPVVISEAAVAFAKSQRQWLRVHRIAHALYQWRNAADNDQRSFWRDVLRVYGAKVPQRIPQPVRAPETVPLALAA